MSYVIVKTNEPIEKGITIFGPMDKDEALKLKLRLAHTKSDYLKVVEVDELDKLDPYNYQGNQEIP